MIHVITLSGNSERFTKKGLPHKSLLDINGKTSFSVFVNSIPDFHNYKTIFLCRNEDLQSTNLKQEIENNSDGKILGIDSNKLGPLYSLSQIKDEIPDKEELVVTYIDSLQKTRLKKMLREYSGFDGGLNVHDFNHPHWKFNKYFCFVKHNKNNICSEVIEKYNFDGLDFDSCEGCCGSSGSYYYRTGELFKKYSDRILELRQTINNEFYITQIYKEMIQDGLEVKAFYCPYGNLGTPEDVNDYIFWERWFNDTDLT
mgnify:CR=1 FL=1|tara:strand:+ start:4377 stop:5147 length:771 start_codon:yes stop_codon:yes gene_type:complete